MLKFVRLTHMYLGVFLAPSILFFAFTGALQSFSLHESHSANYTPPNWLVHMSQMHKNQTLHIPVRKPAPPKPASATPAPAPKPVAAPTTPAARDIHSPTPMKFFFVFVALGLIVSTCLGLYMSYKFNRNKVAVTATLAAGIAIPALLTLF
jgi:hypothetical protein